jgi:hypothetical protein
MLAKFFGKKIDHPMADVKSVQALLADLPRNDALKSAIELTEWIESVASSEEFGLVDQFAVLSLLDETAQFYARKLACEYFTLPDMHIFQGNRLRLVMSNLSRQAADAYYMMFMRYCNGDKGGAAIKAPLLAARAVRAMREKLKYTAVQYEVHDGAIWRNLAQFYQHAEWQQYLDTPVSLYSALPETTSVGSEIGQLMAWYACGLDSLSPRGMHLAERIVAQYRNVITISANLPAHVLCGFDLSRVGAPVRINLDATIHPLMRYVCLADMQVKLEMLIKILHKNIVPQELHLGGVFTAEWVLEAAQHVLTCIVAPPQRLTKRRGLTAQFSVVSGCENVLAYGAGQEHGEHMQISLENASSSGFCAILTGKGVDGVRIGHLFGVQTASGLGVAIVRRLSRDIGGQLHVGAQVLANQAPVLTVRQSVGGGEEQHALWLRESVENGKARLLMQADMFSMQRSLKVHFDGRNCLLIPVELQERGPDYELATFRVIEQEETERQD